MTLARHARRFGRTRYYLGVAVLAAVFTVVLAAVLFALAVTR